MIRKFNSQDLAVVMQIWLKTNIEAHPFIPKSYWESNFENVKAVLPQAEIYVAEVDDQIRFYRFKPNDDRRNLCKKEMQLRGIGKQLLDYAREFKLEL